MKFLGTMSGVLALSLLGTGCATKKYVAKTIAPVEQRVTGTEGKNADQDKTLATHGTQIEATDRDLSATKERLKDTDNKAMQAGEAAKVADQKAGAAQQSADGAKSTADNAKTAADGAKTFAAAGLSKLEAAQKFQMAKAETVLFGLNQDTLTEDGKAALTEFAKQASALDRYVIEVQGFTDKAGDPAYNESLSERRAQTVTRFLVNNFEIPVHNVSRVGSGYAKPVADDKTRDGRKMNRRVEVRLWVPQTEASKTVAGAGQ